MVLSDNTFVLQRPFGPPIGEFPFPEILTARLNEIFDTDIDSGARLPGYGSKLAGEVSQELRIPNEVCSEIGLTDYLQRCVAAYIEAAMGKQINTFELISAWIVRQYKGEYNPIHWHGGDVSGAGWLKVPDGMSGGGLKTADHDGNIVFTHGSRQFLSGSKYEVTPKVGLITVFPAYLMHTVYPFRVDGERRSLAFNARIDESLADPYSSRP